MTRASRTTGALLTALALAGLAGCAIKGAYTDPRLELRAVDGRVLYRLLLIGDAGEPKEPEPVLTLARAWAERLRGRTSVFFLGDNAYPRGMTPNRSAEAERRLARQIDAFAGTGVPVTFLPGNHDWDDGGRRGLEAIIAQSGFVTSRGAGFVPTAGCPGPEVLDLPSPEAAVLRVVALDTQWFLHRHARGTGCDPDSLEGAEARLRQAAATPLPLIVAGHHPLATTGRHGGFFHWREHIFPLEEFYEWGRRFPLPIIGSIFPLSRSLAPWRQDMAHPVNVQMRLAIERALASSTAPALKVYAGGHEHSLQMLTSTAVDYVLVSGSGSSAHQTPVARRYNTLFAHSQAGFMVLDVTERGVWLSIVDPTASPDQPVRQVELRPRR